MTRTVRTIGSTLAMLAIILAACSAPGASQPAASDGGEESAAPSAAPSEGGGDDQVVIGFSQANGGDVWRINQTNNVEDFCAEYMPDAEIVVTDAQGDEAKQDADVDDLIARGIDVLLLTPLSAEALTPAAQRALDASIPVITLDREVDVEVTQHIGADNKLIGETAAQFIAETIFEGTGGTIIEIQGVLGASATTDRHDAFVAWLEENAPDVEIVANQTGEYRREPAQAYMDDMVQRFGPGEFDVVYAHNDEMALGALQSLEAADRTEGVQIVGIDGQNEAIEAIADGRIAATFTYDNAGKEACESASRVIAGEEIDPVWVLETNQIDASNAEEWIGKGF